MPERILIYGVTGSGKTTLAADLAGRTGLPWYSVDDAIGWDPGWTEVDRAEQRRRVERICAGERWILDTEYGHWRDVVLARVQLVVALDYSRALTLARLARRTVARVLTRREICNGNRESVRNTLSRDSIMAWHFRSFAGKRDRMRGWAVDPAAPPTILLSSPRDTRRWLGTVSRADVEGRVDG